MPLFTALTNKGSWSESYGTIKSDDTDTVTHKCNEQIPIR